MRAGLIGPQKAFSGWASRGQGYLGCCRPWGTVFPHTPKNSKVPRLPRLEPGHQRPSRPAQAPPRRLLDNRDLNTGAGKESPCQLLRDDRVTSVH